MQLSGLPWSQLAWVLGAAASWTVALYLLRQRHRVVVVPHLPLWQAVLSEQRTARLGARLRQLLSMLMSLAIAVALAFALGDPRPADNQQKPMRTLLLIDASPSMATRDVAPDRLAVAKELARAAVRARVPGEQMLVASLAATTTPMGGFTGDTQALLNAIDEITLQYREADLDAALRFAQDAVTGDHGRAIVFSDGRLRPLDDATRAPGIPFEYARVGKAGDNLAVTALSLRRYPLDKDNHETFVELSNTGPLETTAELQFRSKGKLVTSERLTLAPMSRLRRTYENLAGIDRTLEAQLIAEGRDLDTLALDDRAYAATPTGRRARILCVTRGSLYLQAALLVDEYLKVDTIEPEAFKTGTQHDVVIFDDFVPAKPPAVPALYLHPATPGPGNPLDVLGEVDGPFFEHLDRSHPLLRWTALDDVNISRALRVRPRDGDQVIGRSERTPLIVGGKRQGVPFIAFSFRPGESDLPLRVAWPLLLLNAIDHFVDDDRGMRRSVSAGSLARVSLPLSDRRIALRGPSGQLDGEVRGGELRFVPPAPGVYWPIAGDDTSDPIAANLSASVDPNIAPVPDLRVGATTAATFVPGPPRSGEDPWTWLLLLAAGLLLFEWWSFHRRWTV